MDPVAAIRQQGEACLALGSPMYADLCARLADDLAAGGVSAEIVGDHPWRGPDALALRILGTVHRLVLERRTGVLAAFYPSVGGTWEASGGWVAFEALLREQTDAVRDGLRLPPQTNEVGRGAALVGGLQRLRNELPAASRLPIGLHEIGASAGLLLRADRVRYVGDDDTALGPADSALVVEGAWPDGTELEASPAHNSQLDGAHNSQLDGQVVARRGCDLDPIDATSEAGRLLLGAYCWPDQTARWERLRGALRIARDVPVTLERADAADFVERLELAQGAVTVLWHSVMWQYLPTAAQDRIATRVEALAAAATPTAPFAHVSLEPRRTADERPFVVRLHAAWGTGGIDVDLGTAAPHGVPCVWVDGPVES